MASSFRGFVFYVLCCALLASPPAAAGEFSVNPIRLELGAAARSGAIAVSNVSNHPLSFQLEAMEWSQDAQGKDQYLETKDLIFFPKILTVEPGQEGVVRVGTRNPIVPVEKTYRLFIQELPSNIVAPKTKGPQVNILIRFGAAIFVTPMKAVDGLEIEGLSLAHGAVAVAAKNTGNRHQVVQGIHLKGTDPGGKEVYSMTLADRYLLTGVVKSYTAAIPSEQCGKIATIEVELKTDKLSASRKLDVTRSMCAPR